MKVKKNIGKTINGFKILDSYVKTLKTGNKTRKVKLECAECGRVFERTSSVDFDHIKCKCKCEYLKPKRNKYHYIDWGGRRYTQTDFCKMHDINVSTFQNRIKSGWPIEEAIKKEFECVCVICEKRFISTKRNKLVCSSTCKNRRATKKGKYKKTSTKVCVVCGKIYTSIRDDAKTCSKRCRSDLARIERSGRYKHLREIGKFDESVTLRNVFTRFGGVCKSCGESLTFDENWLSGEYPSIDHIIPLSKGGNHMWSNVQLLCRNCNSKKGNKTEVSV